MEHFISIGETSSDLLDRVLRRAVRLRADPSGIATGRTLCCLFEKPSLRTRVSFEQAMRRLGGSAMSMSQAEIGLGGRESPEDVIRVLGGMVDIVMARVMSHRTLERMAAVSPVPVINGLSDLAHPAQAMGDLLTLMDEFSPSDPTGLRGRTVAFVGDANNVARSLALACLRFGVNFRICSPDGYGFDSAWLASAAKQTDSARIDACDDPVEAVLHADAIYCDTFVSMGQEAERAERLEAFRHFQVNESLVEQAPRHAIVMHCLPASRGVEITDGVMDGARSRVFRQAHNRLDAQAGLLAELLAGVSGGMADGGSGP